MRVRAAARIPLRLSGVAVLAAAVLRAERSTLDMLSIGFVGESRIRAINLEHLGRAGSTDVIAFSLGGGARMASAGDIYICPRVAERNARRAGQSLREELRRLVVHGTLHAIGYDHPEGEGREAGAMWQRQERYLVRYGGLAK